MIAIEAGVDYRVGEHTEGLCEFSFSGDDDGSPISGRGWARIHDGKLRGMLFIHCGDETSFLAVRVGACPGRSGRPADAADRPSADA